MNEVDSLWLRDLPEQNALAYYRHDKAGIAFCLNPDDMMALWNLAKESNHDLGDLLRSLVRGFLAANEEARASKKEVRNETR